MAAKTVFIASAQAPALVKTRNARKNRNKKFWVIQKLGQIQTLKISINFQKKSIFAKYLEMKRSGVETIEILFRAFLP